MTNGSSAQGEAAPDSLALALRGFGPVGLLAMVVIYFGNNLFAPLSAVLVLAWAWRSRIPWREIGLSKPRSWASVIVGGILLGVAFKLLMKALVMPLLGAPPVNPAFHYLAGNTAALPAAIYMTVIAAGFGEEIFFRGYLFERFGRLLGSSRIATLAIVMITSIWFGLEHISKQGIPGMQQATIVGLTFGGIYAATRRLWILICAHAAFDLTALAIIYWDVERDVAHFLLGPGA